MTGEDLEQKNLIDWAQLWAGRYPVLDRLFHVPNGGHRNKAVAAKLKKLGVKKGIPDLCLPYPMNGFFGLFIEMKTEKGRVSPEQRDYLTFLQSVGYRAEVCRGWVAAAGLIVEYLGLPESVRP